VRPSSLDGFPLRSSWKEPQAPGLLRLALAMELSRCTPANGGAVSRRGGGKYASSAGTQNRAWQERTQPAAPNPAGSGPRNSLERR